MFIMNGGYTNLGGQIKLEQGEEYELRGVYYDFIEKEEKVIIKYKLELVVISMSTGRIKD